MSPALVFLIALITVIRAAPLDQDHREQLAHAGAIDASAPVKNTSAITIHAPVSTVWHLLTDIAAWPSWQPDVTRTDITGPLADGTTFTWVAGATIHSRIALVKPGQQFVWTGTASGTHAIHTWTLRALPDNQTLVQTSESMSGPLLTLFYNSSDLRKSHQHWLDRLKTAAER